MKKIGLFIGKLANGGAERFVSRLSYALNQYYDIYVFVYSDKVLHYPVGGQLVNIGGKHRYKFFSVLHSARVMNTVLRQYQIDVLLSFLDIPNIINGLLNHSCKKVLSIRVFYKKGLWFGAGEWCLYPLVKTALKKSDLITTQTERHKEVLIREFGLESSRIIVCANLFQIKKIEAQAKESLDNERLVSFMNEKTTIAVGRLVPQKNYEVLLKIFSLVHRTIADSRLLILGEGKQLEDLKEKSISLGLKDAVCFGGRLENPFPYEKKCVLYVSTSRQEGFPNALVEAMVCGLPVMHMDCLAGPAEILGSLQEKHPIMEVEYAKYGVLLPEVISDNSQKDKECIKMIADAWIKLLESPDLRKHYSLIGRIRANEYDEEKQLQHYFDLIDKAR